MASLVLERLVLASIHASARGPCRRHLSSRRILRVLLQVLLPAHSARCTYRCAAQYGMARGRRCALQHVWHCVSHATSAAAGACAQLPVSRFQRDLTDSTVLRNAGMVRHPLRPSPSWAHSQSGPVPLMLRKRRHLAPAAAATFNAQPMAPSHLRSYERPSACCYDGFPRDIVSCASWRPV